MISEQLRTCSRCRSRFTTDASMIHAKTGCSAETEPGTLCSAHGNNCPLASDDNDGSQWTSKDRSCVPLFSMARGLFTPTDDTGQPEREKRRIPIVYWEVGPAEPIRAVKLRAPRVTPKRKGSQK
jgi:hypothetical protein